MAHRIDEHAEAVSRAAGTRLAPSATTARSGLIDILDTDIEVQLLWMVGVWPARGHPTWQFAGTRAGVPRARYR